MGIGPSSQRSLDATSNTSDPSGASHPVDSNTTALVTTQQKRHAAENTQSFGSDSRDEVSRLSRRNAVDGGRPTKTLLALSLEHDDQVDQEAAEPADWTEKYQCRLS